MQVEQAGCFCAGVESDAAGPSAPGNDWGRAPRRIPVYESARQNIVGILYVKDLVLVDPDDETELAAVLSFRWGCMYHASLSLVLLLTCTPCYPLSCVQASP